MSRSVDVRIDSIAAGGDGVGRHDGMVVFVPRTDDLSGYELWLRHAGEVIGAGLDRGVALRALTLEPAELLGVGDRVGSLEKGKAANMVFFNGGPQLGEIEAGLVANWFGAPLSVITGGIGCLVATGWVAATTPALRHYRATPVHHQPLTTNH